MTKPVATIKDGWWESPGSLMALGRERLEPCYVNTGNFYIFRCALTLKQDAYFGDRVLPLEITVPPIEVDIDQSWDLELARILIGHDPDLVRRSKIPNQPK